jgi:acyl dehydratase
VLGESADDGGLMAEATVFGSPDELKTAVGRHLGYSDWLEVTQDRINQFAEATDDHQWIHVDAERAAKGPFGQTVAHGYLTLALVSALLPQLIEVRNVSMSINYGTNKVRFPSPVPVGSLVRAKAEIVSADAIAGGVQATFLTMIEREGAEKPCCVAESIIRYLTSEQPADEAESAGA